MTGAPDRPDVGSGALDPWAYEVVATPLAGDHEHLVEQCVEGGHFVGGRLRTVAAMGTAVVLELAHGLEDPGDLDAVVDWLAAVPRRGAPGATGDDGDALPGAVAVGAFPFDRAAPASLVVPVTAWCREPSGRTWVVHVVRRGDPVPPSSPVAPIPAPGPAGPAHAVAGAIPGTGPTEPVVHPVPPEDRFADAVATALREIGDGRLRKVVLARALDVEMDPVPAPSQVLRRLWDDDPAFVPFSVPVPGGRLVGASPELIVSRLGDRVSSHAFAGTVALDGAAGDDEAMARLEASTKDQAEHRLVVEEIAGALRSRTATLDVPAAPSVVRLRSDARLGTMISGRLAVTGGPSPRFDSALRLLAALHPTPAVGGVPRQAALDLIRRVEPAARGYWAGTVGWIDGAGDGEWVLALRSAVLGPTRVRICAGAGIVSGSVPARELAETTLKLAPVLEALRPGLSGRG